MKKHTLTLCLSFILIGGFAAKASEVPSSRKIKTGTTIHPVRESDLLRITAFKSYTAARKHHIALFGADEVK